MNKVFLLARIVADPELRHTNSGTAVADLRVVSNRKYGETEESTFVDVTVWGKTAEICCEYLEKGRQVLIEGRLRQETWETEDGQKRSKISVVGENVQFLSGKKNEQKQLAESF